MTIKLYRFYEFYYCCIVWLGSSCLVFGMDGTLNLEIMATESNETVYSLLASQLSGSSCSSCLKTDNCTSKVGQCIPHLIGNLTLHTFRQDISQNISIVLSNFQLNGSLSPAPSWTFSVLNPSVAMFLKIDLELEIEYVVGVVEGDGLSIKSARKQLCSNHPFNTTGSTYLQCQPYFGFLYSLKYTCKDKVSKGQNCDCHPTSNQNICYNCTESGSKVCCNGFSQGGCSKNPEITTLSPAMIQEMSNEKKYFIAMWALTAFAVLTLFLIICLLIGLIVYCRKAKKYKERATPLRVRSERTNIVYPITRQKEGQRRDIPLDSLPQTGDRNYTVPKQGRPVILSSELRPSPEDIDTESQDSFALYAQPYKNGQKPSPPRLTFPPPPPSKLNDSFDSFPSEREESNQRSREYEDRSTAPLRPPTYAEHQQRHPSYI